MSNQHPPWLWNFPNGQIIILNIAVSAKKNQNQKERNKALKAWANTDPYRVGGIMRRKGGEQGAVSGILCHRRSSNLYCRGRKIKDDAG